MMEKLNGYKTYIALALSLIFQGLSATHKVNLDPNAAADVTNVLYQIAAAVMAGAGIWGRLKATTPGALADPKQAVADAKSTILEAPLSAGGVAGGTGGTVTKLIALVFAVLLASSAVAQTDEGTDRRKTGPLDSSITTGHLLPSSAVTLTNIPVTMRSSPLTLEQRVAALERSRPVRSKVMNGAGVWVAAPTDDLAWAFVLLDYHQREIEYVSNYLGIGVLLPPELGPLTPAGQALQRSAAPCK